jgi:hypothetical protein
MAMLFGSVFLYSSRKRRTHLSRSLLTALFFALLGLGSFGLTGCGGGFAVPNKITPTATTYTITVTGISGSVQHTTSVKLIVQ